MPVEYRAVTLGCDPETFFEIDNKVIGSEKILKQGIFSEFYKRFIPSRVVVEDGVQGEFHPEPSTCRSLLGNSIARAIWEADVMAKSKGARISFKLLVKVKKEEMLSLSPASRRLGCAPSLYIDKGVTTARFKRAAESMTRCGGGHIHFGAYYDNQMGMKSAYDPKVVVPLLDLLLGNTCVLLDRDPANVKRRQVYGLAGEYRTPTHGLEYRTLSNFWLRAYPIYSFVFGLARQTINLWQGGEAESFLSLVPRCDVVRAINTNSFDLAMNNFLKIEKKIKEVFVKEDSYDHDWTLKKNNIKQFLMLVEKGLDHFFPSDTESIIESWNHRYDKGWNLWKESYLR